MSPVPEILPMDEFNLELLRHVHPAGYQNPTPSGRYNLVVLGAGTAGLVTAVVAAGLGAKVALIERKLMGGDCLNVGCVPSKTLIRAAHAASQVREAGTFGVQAAEPDVDFAEVMRRLRQVRAEIAPHDSVERYSEEVGVDVFLGEGRFVSDTAVEVEGVRLEFARAVIATGARAAPLPIDGLAEVGYLTNETVFELCERPSRLAVIGAGPIGCELAQSFQRLGSQVTLLEVAPQILIREDRDAADIVDASLRRDGVALEVGVAIARVEPGEAGAKRIHFASGGVDRVVEVDEILLGVGRKPNVEKLGLDAAGVRFDERTGVEVDDHLRTSQPRIFAAGDVCMAHKFTHAADAAAKIVVQNALFFGRKKLSDVIMPWCTYTDPEIAHVGLYPRDAEQRGLAIDTYTTAMAQNDRARAEGDTEGFIKVHVKKGSDRIVGATIVARQAGELISQVTLAMNAGVGLGTFTNVVHPYPTKADVLRATAGAYTRTRLTPLVARLFRLLLRLRR